MVVGLNPRSIAETAAVAPGNKVEYGVRICAAVAPVPPTFKVETPSKEDAKIATLDLMEELSHITGFDTSPFAKPKK